MATSSKSSVTVGSVIEDAYVAPKSVEKEAVFDPYLVTLEPEDDPQQMSTFRRWIVVLVISFGSLCATCGSSVAAFSETGSSETFHVSKEVTIVGVSIYVIGLGAGPLLVGPLSEVYGRKIIYRVSYVLFFLLTLPVAFAPNIAVFLVFRGLTGLCGSAFLSVGGGSVSDMFPRSAVANPMAIYSMSPFIGPVAGPVISGFINQNANWRWTYWMMMCWSFGEVVMLFLLVPETYVPVILKKKAARLRKTTGDSNYYAPLEKTQGSLYTAIKIACYRPFQLLLFDRMAFLLDAWNALLLGILYLAFQVFPIIFQGIHHFNEQMTGLSFLGMGVGLFLASFTQPFWNRLSAREAEKSNGNPPPEILLIMGQVGGILFPTSLFWLAFTTYPQVHWIAPIIASVPFGASVYFVFTSTFTYLVTAYRPIAASAMASNGALRSVFAAVFSLFAGPMYERLGTVGATALLAGLATLMAPLPFIFYRIGARLRMKSQFAIHS